MKYSKSIPLFGIVAAVVGILGMNAMSSGFSPVGVNEQGTGEDAKVMGHLIVTVKNSNGEITAYRQTDNAIVNKAFSCAPLRLFGTSVGDCTATPSNYNVIALSNTAAASHVTTQGDLAEVTVAGLAAATADTNTVTTTSSATATGTASSITTISKTFTTTTGMATTTVQAAALQDATSTNSANLFAAKTFSSVTVNPGDTLTVQWQITLQQ